MYSTGTVLTLKAISASAKIYNLFSPKEKACESISSKNHNDGEILFVGISLLHIRPGAN